jgi:hypothetical protein
MTISDISSHVQTFEFYMEDKLIITEDTHPEPL